LVIEISATVLGIHHIGDQCIGVMEHWSVGMLYTKAGKNLIYIFLPFFPTGTKKGSFFSPLHHSTTPILRLQ
jgi:hypothetical protein